MSTLAHASGSGSGASTEVGSLAAELHRSFIYNFCTKHDAFEYIASEYLRVNGLYWCLTAMHILGRPDALPKDSLIDVVMTAWDPVSGGFGASEGHDAYLPSTLCAVQVLATLGALDRLDVDKTVAFVVSLQQASGAFAAEASGIEIDTRFTMCAFACLALLGRLDDCNVDQGVDYIVACRNFDGAFGRIEGSESHAAQVFCCVGALSIAGALDRVNRDQLAWWLCERQTPSGGFNGRPEKLPDVCYSWWIYSSLVILGRDHWVDKQSLKRFILRAQDKEDGGIADREGDMADPFHTLFGSAALSLIGHADLSVDVNPVFCMPQSAVARLNVKYQTYAPYS